MPLPEEATAEAIKPTLDEIDAQAEQERIAAFNSHPHTRLTGLQKQMSAPTALDVSGRIGMLHSVVAQLVQIIKEHTPAPEKTDGQG